MRFRLLNILAASIAAGVMLVTLAGLLSEEGIPANFADVTLQLFIVTAALALLLGLINLLTVHLGKITRRENGMLYSLVTILSAAGVIAVYALNPKGEDGEEIRDVVFESVQVSLEAALGGLLFFFLVYAAYRMMRQRVSASGCYFTAALVLVLLGAIPLNDTPVLVDLRNWLMEFPVTAGTRGILIGIGLGIVTVSLRVLIGQERAYREE
jgi:cell division protein FtsW (lipid II flippase)